mmetsp:Transcript_10364/g.17070  ORF Transcript_10364/g.17070 Transcript_10364/m.17070 type:complete len:575 (+) Transcript_10364:1923-3647(+)
MRQLARFLLAALRRLCLPDLRRFLLEVSVGSPVAVASVTVPAEVVVLLAGLLLGAGAHAVPVMRGLLLRGLQLEQLARVLVLVLRLVPVVVVLVRHVCLLQREAAVLGLGLHNAVEVLVLLLTQRALLLLGRVGVGPHRVGHLVQLQLAAVLDHEGEAQARRALPPRDGLRAADALQERLQHHRLGLVAVVLPPALVVLVLVILVVLIVRHILPDFLARLLAPEEHGQVVAPGVRAQLPGHGAQADGLVLDLRHALALRLRHGVLEDGAAQQAEQSRVAAGLAVGCQDGSPHTLSLAALLFQRRHPFRFSPLKLCVAVTRLAHGDASPARAHQRRQRGQAVFSWRLLVFLRRAATQASGQTRAADPLALAGDRVGRVRDVQKRQHFKLPGELLAAARTARGIVQRGRPSSRAPRPALAAPLLHLRGVWRDLQLDAAAPQDGHHRQHASAADAPVVARHGPLRVVHGQLQLHLALADEADGGAGAGGAHAPPALLRRRLPVVKKVGVARTSGSGAGHAAQWLQAQHALARRRVLLARRGVRVFVVLAGSAWQEARRRHAHHQREAAVLDVVVAFG